MSPPTTPYPVSVPPPRPPAPVPLSVPADDGEPARRARAISWRGIRTVLVLELRQRVRSTRWKVALSAFFALVAIVSLLLMYTFSEDRDGGRFVYELVLLFVFGLGLLVTPTLASTAINGDRNAGTLAIMQITKLSPADLALGKLLASWLASLSFLAVSMPFLLWSWLTSVFGFVTFVRGLAVLALLLAVVCAFSLGFSALTNRTAGSSVLSYLTVGSLTIIGLIIFGLTVPVVTVERDVRVYTVPETGNWDDECEWVTERVDVVHTDRTWWLLVVNPFVVLADAASPPSADDPLDWAPLELIRGGVRAAREGPSLEEDWCYNDNRGPDAPEPRELSDAPFWPWGLGLNVMLGAGGLVFAIRRLAVPYRRLPTGARVA